MATILGVKTKYCFGSKDDLRKIINDFFLMIYKLLNVCKTFVPILSAKSIEQQFPFKVPI
jgi:hypothetical protein